MVKDSGALPGSQASPGAAEEASPPIGFDPARLTSLSFVLPFDDGSERLSVVHDSRSKHWSDKVVIRQYDSDDNTVCVDLADLDWLIGALKLAAIAIEARQRPDPEEGLDPKGESAGRRHRPTPVTVAQGEEEI